MAIETARRIDLHVHSKYSTRPSQWVLQKIGCAESYTEPLHIYRCAKDRGMHFVTVTDHNSLAGSLEIAHLENTFVSEEITTYFPENRCKLHVLAWDITERQHEDITRLRENVFDLVPYLRQEKIIHALAHPMYSPNDRLNHEGFEKMLLLFKTFELNGARDEYQNSILMDILTSLTPQDIETLANKHNLEPSFPEPWRKHLVGGSDDHSSLTIAAKYTEVEGVSTPREFLSAIGEYRAVVRGRESAPRVMAHNLYSIAYQFYKKRFSLDRHLNRDLLLRFVEHALTAAPAETDTLLERMRILWNSRLQSTFSRPDCRSVKGRVQKEAREIIYGDERMMGLIKDNHRSAPEMQEVWFSFVRQVADKVLTKFADAAMESISGADLFDIFQIIGSAGSLYTMLAPYFVSYGLFTKDRKFCRECAAKFTKESNGYEEPINVAHFTDTFHEVNGVALTLQMQVEISQKYGKDLTIITCGNGAEEPGVTAFAPVGNVELPEYPELKLSYPPLLEMLEYCYEHRFTLIHAATPGPIGLAALAIARILKLPIHGTYHTALPQYVSELTGDTGLEDVAWRYMVWFYNQMDLVFVPSTATGDELAERGVDKSKITFYPRGIDTQRFHPSKRNGFFKERYRFTEAERTILYVGRVSKEKNLPFLTDVFKRIATSRQRLRLVIVGEGPYLEEMRQELKGLPVVFTGYLAGDDLAQAYASSDVFVFPSTTDTFGNVVLEAQASGIPVVVTDQGGPRENMVDGLTGIVASSTDPAAFADAVLSILEDPQRMNVMRKQAREYLESRSFESAYLELWEMYRSNTANLADFVH